MIVDELLYEAKLVAYYNASGLPAELLEISEDFVFGLLVDVSCGFVEDQDSGTFQQCSCQHKLLFLPT